MCTLRQSPNMTSFYGAAVAGVACSQETLTAPGHLVSLWNVNHSEARERAIQRANAQEKDWKLKDNQTKQPNVPIDGENNLQAPTLPRNRRSSMYNLRHDDVGIKSVHGYADSSRMRPSTPEREQSKYSRF
ncbi:hypothetical protein FSP39_006568 [Pinctada imbricata]|uniref:Uncharacterized protein n=1 Tax=Pinctada imbricata TaxID=66713 RepID=A0AA88YCS3_PINIB|nr:hypothetical protein FSP39_006568 [Pinctada imbricata]